MSDVTFHRCHRQGHALSTSIGVGQGLQLDRIAEHCAGPMGLDIAHRRGRQAGVGQRFANQRLLGRSVGYREPRAGAVMVDRRAQQNGDDPVAVRPRPFRPLEDHHAATLAAAVAIGTIVEGLAGAVRR